MPETHVECQLCGVARKRLQAHLKAAHGLTPDEYREQFPGALTDAPGSRKRSPECRAKMADAARKRWTNPEEREAQSERMKESAPWKSKTLSEEHRAAISAGGKGVTHNLSEEEKKARGDRGRIALENARRAPGYREKLSEGQRRWWARGEVSGFRDPEVRKRVWESRIRNGNLVTNGGRGVTGFRKGISHYCRSTLEANFARILLLEGIPYEYEPRVFLLPGGLRWTPDFRLLAPLGDIPAGWVELKGWRKKDGSLPGKASEKVAAFEQMTGEAVHVLVQSSPEWAVLRDRYSTRVPWEKPRYNLKTHPEVFGSPE